MEWWHYEWLTGIKEMLIKLCGCPAWGGLNMIAGPASSGQQTCERNMSLLYVQ